MIIVTVHHWCEPGRESAARQRIDDNGDAMAQCEGFLFRYRMGTAKDPLQISTVTGWQSEALYRRWQDRKRAAQGAAASPYSRVENQVFEVHAVHDIAQAGSPASASAGAADA